VKENEIGTQIGFSFVSRVEIMSFSTLSKADKEIETIMSWSRKQQQRELI
jgi:hypothetical protein